jgi:hypothetical protein
MLDERKESREQGTSERQREEAINPIRAQGDSTTARKDGSQRV